MELTEKEIEEIKNYKPLDEEKLYFKPLKFKFVYKDGREYFFTGSCGLCAAKYKAHEEDIAEVFQMVNSRYTKISK